MADEKKTEQVTLIPNGGYPMHTYEDLRELFCVYIKDSKDRELIHQAYLLAKEKHAGVFRRSGEPYIQHPIAQRPSSPVFCTIPWKIPI